MKEFFIDPEFLTTVIDETKFNLLENPNDPTMDDLMLMIQNRHELMSIGNIDHWEFTLLREQLGREGYIKIERGWWNGDQVLKPFNLNGVQFKKNATFPCASAMKVRLEYKQNSRVCQEEQHPYGSN